MREFNNKKDKNLNLATLEDADGMSQPMITQHSYHECEDVNSAYTPSLNGPQRELFFQDQEQDKDLIKSQIDGTPEYFRGSH